MTSPAHPIDLAVIGSGPGGYAAALTGARRGLRVALIEREHWGGVCLNVGCIPTKALLAVAHLIRRIQRADRLGIRVHGYTLDFAQVRKRNARIIATLRRGLTDMLQHEQVQLVEGEAIFESPTRLTVTRHGEVLVLEPQRVVVATGARPVAGPWTIDEERVVSYRGLLAMPMVPASLLIIGGGAIGCEFACCFGAFGSRVTVVEHASQLLPGEDPEAVRWLVRRLEADGVRIVTGATVTALERRADGVAATLSDGTQHQAERCLVAVGQHPNIDTLQLPRAAVQAGRGVVVDERLRTSQPHIAAIGDCIDGHGVAHWASAEGVLAVEGLLGDGVRALTAHDVPRCVYTDPEIAQVGVLESEAGDAVRVSRFAFAALGKSHCDDESEGFVKLLVDPATDRIRGATIVAIQASNLIHHVVVAMRQGVTARQLARTITAHPTWPESITEAAAHLYGESLALAARGGRRSPLSRGARELA